MGDQVGNYAELFTLDLNLLYMHLINSVVLCFLDAMIAVGKGYNLIRNIRDYCHLQRDWRKLQ